MSLKTNLPRWIFASVAKHFVDGLSIHTFVEGTERRTNDQRDWIEVRIDGPNIEELTNQSYYITSEVNLLVCTQMKPTSAFLHSTNIGLATELFTNIKIYKYGSQDADTGDLLGCYILQPEGDKHGGIEIANMGQIDASLKLLQTTIEGHYRMYVEE